MLIDTHCHLDFKDFDVDRDEVISRALKAGVGKMINVGSSIEGSRRSVELAQKIEAIYASVGIHPHDASTVTDQIMEELTSLAASPKVVAIGEVGLDYYRNLSPKDAQISAFRRFLYLSFDLGLPVILHSREADTDMLDILKKERKSGLRGVVHCFSGDADLMKAYIDLGLYVSFTANITFKKADPLRLVARDVPHDRFMLETDAPFLAPQAMRGQRNEPANLTHLVGEWSRLLDLSKEDVARITSHNAGTLFGLGRDESSRIVYEIRDSIYLNITNRCTSACSFCVRNSTDFVKGHNLRIDREPSADELVKAVQASGRSYKEVVFCGYGEPTLRLDVVKEVARRLKAVPGTKTRLVTNGHGNLINSRTIAKELYGLVDSASVSLNTDTADTYNKYCKPGFGERSYDEVKKFARDCVSNGITVEITCLDLAGVDLARCEAIAKELGGTFRKRSIGVVG